MSMRQCRLESAFPDSATRVHGNVFLLDKIYIELVRCGTVVHERSLVSLSLGSVELEIPIRHE